jgi:acetyl esterase
MGLKPEIKQYLAQRAQLGLPLVWQAPLSEVRDSTYSHIALSQPLIDLFEVKKLWISGPTANLPVRIYRDDNSANKPALIFFHGGGWVLNFLDIYEPALRKLAKISKLVIVAVEYQKAPEHPYPTPFNDCYATLEWVVKNSKSLGVDTSAIGVGGDSAGGNLASAVALKTRDTKLVDLAFQLLIYPCNDYRMNYDSAIKFSENFGLTSKAMKWFWQQYLQKESDKLDAYAVPILSKSLVGVAPALIYTAEFDPLVDDGKNYHLALKNNLVPSIYKEFPGQIHGFFNLSGITNDAESLYSDISIEINQLLGRV